MRNEADVVVGEGTDVCFRCRYDLRGLTNEVGCPECGLLVGRSRMPTEELRHGRPGWLWKLSGGIWVMLAGLLGAGVWFCVMAPVMEWVERKTLIDAVWIGSTLIPVANTSTIWRLAFEHLPLVGFELAAGLVWLGAVLVTWPEGRAERDRADRGRRWAIRLSAAMPLVGLGVIHAISRWYELGNHLTGWVMAGLVGLCVPGPALLLFQMRHLARRVLNASLAEQCAIVGVGMSATLGVVAGWCVVMEVFGAELRGWISRSTLWMVLLAVMGALGVLFYVWGVCLAVRFAWAIGKARRKAIADWRAADLAR